MKTLMLFSGGADSAYIAYKILTETTNELTALTFVNSDDFSVAWTPRRRFLMRIDNLFAELKKIRDFTVIKKPVLSTEIHPENDNPYLYGIEWAADAINNGTYDEYVTGRTWEQQNQSLFKGSTVKGTPTYFASVNLWNKLVTRGRMYDPLVDNSYHVGFNRWHILKYLPPNIRQYTISCHNPRFNAEATDVVECGTCYKCLWEEKTQEFIDKGYSAEQLNAWRRLTALEYGGGNDLSAPIRYWISLEMGKGDILTVERSDGTRLSLNTKQKIQNFVQTQEHYTYRDRPKTGIWDISNFLNGT